MASKPSSDGWLWAGLAILAYFGSLALHTQLVAIRQASQVTRHDKRPNISQKTEDALKLKALAELTQSPDQNIRAASVKIITDRAIRQGPAWDTMIRHLASLDIERRDKALTCLRFLCPSFPSSKHADTVICRPSTYEAIVDCLCNLLPEAQISEKNSAFLTQSERNALYVLHHILSFDVAKAIEAGVIRRWLVQYPFGGADASRNKKKKTVTELIDSGPCHEDSDYRHTLRVTLSYMSRSPSLRQEMVEHGLLDDPKGNEITVDDDWDIPEASSRTNSFFNRTSRGIPIGTSSRPREESLEEQALRRRRREAMVLGEVGRPVERTDIIERDSAVIDGFRSLLDESQEDSRQPVDAVADEDVEEELGLVMEDMTQTKTMRPGGWWSWLTRLRPDGLARESI